MLRVCKKGNLKQYQLVTDPSAHVVGLCPRRAGKSWAAAIAALITGEAKPGSISIIISLNLKQLKRLYWAGGPSGLFTLARKFNLNLQWNHSMLKWEHENGSIGYLMGAEDDEQLEVLRGLEADLYVIDECKSFSPARLRKLVVEILSPQRASRQGRIMMIGTPGNAPAGPFWEASCPGALDSQKRPFSVPYGEKDPFGRPRVWSRHHWTLEDNKALPHQWEEALITRDNAGWDATSPIWRREYLGEWAEGGDGLVFRYAEARGTGRVTWIPEPTKDNPTGLPEEGAPWRLIGGLDIGFEDRTAFVVAGYSARLRELRHVYDVSKAHMVVDDLADMLAEAYERFGQIEVIHADAGSLGKMVVESLVRRGFPIEKAEKREKFDHIELLNSALTRGEVKIIEGTTLEQQLLTGSWDLKDGTRDELAKVGRLREDESIPNDSTDAFLYLYRGSLHQFGHQAPTDVPAPGTREWVELQKNTALKKAREQLNRPTDPRLGRNPFETAPTFVRAALQKRDRWQSAPPTFKRTS